MRKGKIILIAIYIILSSGFLSAQDPICIGEKKMLFSHVLNEQREVWVHLPKSYNNTDIKSANYPVIYLLDAEINFNYYAPMVDFLAKEPYAEIPEMIIVGIKNTNRTRDLTPTHSTIQDPQNPKKRLFDESGGGNTFLTFIQEELKPFISQNYRTENFEIFVGHSFGGVMVIHTMITLPQLFNAYVANDPSLWWDKEHILKSMKEKRFVLNTALNKRTLFLSQAFNEEKNKVLNKDMMKSIQKFNDMMQETTFGLHYHYRFYPHDDHGTVAFPANYDALRFIFNGFKTDSKEMVTKPERLPEHYHSFSNQMGYKFYPSETYLNLLIRFAEETNNLHAKEYFKKMKCAHY